MFVSSEYLKLKQRHVTVLPDLAVYLYLEAWLKYYLSRRSVVLYVSTWSAKFSAVL